MTHPPQDPFDTSPPVDVDFARTLPGKLVLIGITVEDRHGQFLRQEQFHGTVVSADPEAGIELALRGRHDGETKWLPPATHLFEPAPPGTYTLRTSGEQVVDPYSRRDGR
jgi:hypothetical protein